jgi:peptidoglycan/LPS O-acetylase OafA/YrhL
LRRRLRGDESRAVNEAGGSEFVADAAQRAVFAPAHGRALEVSTPARAAAERHLWIDRVRGVTAMYVVLHHAVLNIDGAAAQGVLARLLGVVFGAGHYAVDVFIVLSGFCLMLPLLRKERFGDVGTFALRRSVRIVLPYYGAMALSLLLIATVVGGPTSTHWAVSVPVTRWDVVSHLLLIQQWSKATRATINHAFWSIGVEYQIYFLFPAIFGLARRFGLRAITALATLAGYVGWYATLKLGGPDPSPWGASFYYVGLFCMGALAAQEGSRHQEREGAPSLADRAVPLLLIAGVAVCVALHVRELLPLQERSAFVGATTALYCYFRATRARRIGVESSSSPFARALGVVGAMGFSLYLIHAPILEVCWRYVVAPLHLTGAGPQMLAMLLVGGAASLAVAAAFHRLVEQPCHELSRKVTLAQRAR